MSEKEEEESFNHEEQNEEEENGLSEQDMQEIRNFSNKLENKKQENEVPSFGRNFLQYEKIAEKFAEATKQALINLRREKFPSIEELDNFFLIFRGRKIFYYIEELFTKAVEKNPKFEIVFSKYILNHFVIYRRFINLGGLYEFLKYVLQLQEDHLRLLSFSSSGDQYLTQNDFSDYLREKLLSFKKIEKAFSANPDTIDYYLQFVLENTYIALDKINRNRLTATEILCSPQFAQVLDLEFSSSNDLSIPIFRRSFSAFQKSTNTDGLMPPNMFKNACGVRLCDAFVERVYEIIPTYDGCLDFSGFLHIYTLIDKVDEYPRLFFQILDADDDYIISPSDILYFYNSLCSEVQCGVSFDTFLQEMLDNFSCDRKGITYDRFCDSGCGLVTIQILSDVNEFEQYVSTSGATQV